MFYKFDTQSKPGFIIAEGVRFEQVELPVGEGFDQTKFSILCKDHQELRGVDLKAFKQAVTSNFPSS